MGRTFFYDHERNEGWNERLFEYEIFPNTKGTKWDELLFTTTKGTKRVRRAFEYVFYDHERNERDERFFEYVFLRLRRERKGDERFWNDWSEWRVNDGRGMV